MQARGRRAALVALVSAFAGCRVVAGTAVLAVATAGMAGYTVYAVGDAAVTGVGLAAKAGGNAVAAGSRSAATVVFRDGAFETEVPASLAEVWSAADTAFRKARFERIRGGRDALSGELEAETRDGTDISLHLKRLEPERTELRIRVGVKGDLQTSETVHELIEAELVRGVTP
jgi:hypothetical protein